MQKLLLYRKSGNEEIYVDVSACTQYTKDIRTGNVAVKQISSPLCQAYMDNAMNGKDCWQTTWYESDDYQRFWK